MSGVDKQEQYVFYRDSLTVEVDLNTFACNAIDSDRVTDFFHRPVWNLRQPNFMPSTICCQNSYIIIIHPRRISSNHSRLLVATRKLKTVTKNLRPRWLTLVQAPLACSVSYPEGCHIPMVILRIAQNKRVDGAELAKLQSLVDDLVQEILM